MLNEETFGYMLTNMYKRAQAEEPVPNVKTDVSEKEAMQIFNELLKVYQDHNVSYQCACRLSLAMNEAFMCGAVELYNQDKVTHPYRD